MTMTGDDLARFDVDQAACRAALELAGVGLWLVDLVREQVVLSPEAKHLYGRKDDGPISIVEWRRAVSPEDHPRILAAFAGPDGAAEGEHRFGLRADDGRERHLQECWRPAPHDNGGRTTLLGVVSDVSDDVRQGRRRRELIHELQHRMKNMLAVVRSIARRTAAHSDSVESFSAHFEGRLAALANVQVTLARTATGRADLEDIVRQELVHSFGSDEGVVIDGPAIALRGRMVELIALALHELAANAIKFGESPTGRGLAVTWEERRQPPDEHTLLLTWKEPGRPFVTETARSGFGLELIQRGLPYELDARVDVKHTTSGLICRIELPLGPRAG